MCSFYANKSRIRTIITILALATPVVFCLLLLKWSANTGNCVLSLNGSHIVSKCYDDFFSPSCATIRTFELGGEFVDEYFASDIRQYYPPRFAPRFKILEPKIEHSGLLPKLDEFARIQRCDFGLRPIGSPITIREAGFFWLTLNGKMLVLGKRELKLLEAGRDDFYRVVGIETRPIELLADSDVNASWVVEPSNNHVLFTSDSKTAGSSHGTNSFSELYKIENDSVRLVSSWPIQSRSVSVCVEGTIVSLSREATHLIHYRVETGEVVRKFELPKSRNDADIEFGLLPHREILIVDDFDGEIRTRYDPLDLSAIPHFVKEGLSPDRERDKPHFVYWDRAHQTAWYSFDTQLIGVTNGDTRSLTVNCPFLIADAEYSVATNSIVALGVSPPDWKVVDLKSVYSGQSDRHSIGP